MNPFAFPSGMAGAMGGGASSSTTTTTASADTSRNSKQKSKNAESSDPNFGGLGTLGVAASQAASLGMNQASKLLTYYNF